jgi:hypothetical protein
MKRTLAGLVGLAALTSLLGWGAPADEATQVRLALPEPTGPYSVGRRDLRGRAQPLLDGPSERYPEVKFW